jgi:hypothetical protein
MIRFINGSLPCVAVTSSQLAIPCHDGTRSLWSERDDGNRTEEDRPAFLSSRARRETIGTPGPPTSTLRLRLLPPGDRASERAGARQRGGEKNNCGSRPQNRRTTSPSARPRSSPPLVLARPPSPRRRRRSAAIPAALLRRARSGGTSAPPCPSGPGPRSA